MKRTKIQKIIAFVSMIVIQLAYFYAPFDGSLHKIQQAVAANANGMVVYPVSASAIPRYRTWNGSEFSTEGSASTAVATIQYSVVKEAPSRSEYVLGTLASTGVNTFQIYNGTWNNLFTTTPGVGTTYDAQRNFDISYEQYSGDAIVVYEDTTTANKTIKYQIWNGSSWVGGEQTLTYTSGSDSQIAWVRLETKPFSDEMILVTEDILSDIRAFVWDGDSWGNEQLLTAGASALTSMPFDVAYEYNSGDAMVIWGQLATLTLNYITWENGAWTSVVDCDNNTGLTNVCGDPAGAISSIDIAGSNENDYIGLVFTELTGGDAGTQVWDGTQWLALPQTQSTWDEAGAVEFAASEKVSGAVYEDAGNRFMFGYTLSGLFNMTYLFYDLDEATWYNGDGTTAITDMDSVTTNTGNIGTDDTGWINLKPNPDDASQIMLTINDIDVNTRSRLWDGLAWSTPTNGDHGINTTSLIGGQGSFTWDRTIAILTVGTEGTQETTLPIQGTDKNIGGAFTFVRNAGTDSITSITLNEEGDVDANADLSNVIVWYKQEATCSSAIPSDAIQFNTTPGSFDVSDQVTVSTSTGMSVGTSQFCVYVSLDIGSGATVGEKINIEITAPATDITATADKILPSTAVAISGDTTLADPKLTVSTEGTQKDAMGIPSENNAVGGAFTFTRDAASTNVTSIKLTETQATVEADTELSNVIVWYKEEETCSEVFPADGATQFNSTPGTFSLEEVTVMGSMTVDTDKTCVYVKLDVLDTAENGDLLDIQITNPSTDVVVSSQTVSPATVVAISGITTLSTPTYTSYGAPFLYTQANWGTDGSGVDFFYEVYWRKTVGNVYTRVYDETAAAEVSGSMMATSSADFVRGRTSALTLTDGHIYRAQLGHVNGASGEALGAKLIVEDQSGGADLAEYYKSKDTLDLGEVVAIDPAKVGSVKRSSKAYQQDILGVVSTQPGIILGENIGQSYPIALIGRVPVKVSTENGIIREGDAITASSIPGYAMKATVAGRVLGRALGSLDEKKLGTCPAFGMGNVAGTKCGTVMVFVNLIDYQGQSVDIAMSEWKAARAVNISANNATGAATTSIFAGAAAGTATTTALDTATSSDMGLVLNEETISGKNTSTASITAESPPDSAGALSSSLVSYQSEVLEFLASLKQERASNTFASSSEIFTDRVNAISEIITPSMFAGALDVSGSALFQGGLIVNSIGSSGDILSILSDTIFIGRPYFNADTAGFAVMASSTLSVAIAFEREYLEQPVVNASISFEAVEIASSTENIATSTLEEILFANNISYVITAKSTKGFTILLNKPAPIDINFSWIALAVKNPKIFSSIPQEIAVPEALSVESPPVETPPASPDTSQGRPAETALPAEEPAPPPTPLPDTPPVPEANPLPDSNTSSTPENNPSAPETPPASSNLSQGEPAETAPPAEKPAPLPTPLPDTPSIPLPETPPASPDISQGVLPEPPEPLAPPAESQPGADEPPAPAETQASPEPAPSAAEAIPSEQPIQ